MKRPSFLVFMTDQQRADHLGCYGNRLLRTPNIDSIARRGVTFDRFNVSSPVCMPNRAALATGRMPSAAGVRMNGVPLPLSARTHVEALRTAGYRTGLIGKCHLQNMTDVPPTWSSSGNKSTYLTQADSQTRTGREYQQESIARWSDPAHEVTLPYYGFEHVELCIEHGDQVGGDYARWLHRRGFNQAQLTGPGRAGAVDGRIAPQSWRTALTEDDYPSAFVRDRTIAWMTSHAQSAIDQPFYLQCSFPDPHHPFTPPGRWFDAYKADDVPLPESFELSTASDTPIKLALHAELAEGRRNASRSSRVVAVTAAEARDAIALTWGSIAMIDAMIGQIVETLAELRLEQDTVIVFMSDHGDFMGDHGLLFKGPLHYRSVRQMPFIWSDPYAPTDQRRPQLASAIDFAPTILARADIQPHYGVQGLDLGPAILDANVATRDAVLIEEESHRPLPGTKHASKVRTIVTERWRMSVHCGEPWGELYDLQNDPNEAVNQWNDPGVAHVRGDLLWRLVDLMARYSDDCPLPTRMA